MGEGQYHIARSQWLSYQNSLNHALFIALQRYLNTKNLPGVMKTTGRNGKLVSFGTLVDVAKPFAIHYPNIATGFREANARRNTLPASHPYEIRGGSRTRHLSKREQGDLALKLSHSYQGIVNLL